MREPVTISRASVKDNEAAFAELKARGVTLAQQISGNIWSDYNAHDPGITILEQLCYALTELTYHTDFDVADLLQNDDGVVDYSALSLLRPEEVFPCRPTTITDLRKALLDEVKELDNIWLKAEVAEAGANSVSGVYHAEIRRDRDSTIDDMSLVEKVVVAFNNNRNLCEELAGVVLLEDRECTLHATVEVDSSRHADELLAEIYFRCGEYVSGNNSLRAYMELLQDGMSLEQLFDGPLTRHGLFEINPHSLTDDEVVVPTLFSIINSITGVEHIKGLHLELDGERFYEALPRRDGGDVICLDLPALAGGVKVELVRNGGVLPFSMGAVKKRYQEMHFRHDSMREVAQDFSALYSLPQGSARGLAEYGSIQQQFPAIYGINHFGTSGESVEAVSRARQLKSYLLLFEQLMANFSATCGSLNEVYSTENDRRQTYDYRVISEETIPDINLIYPERPAEAIAAILSRYDDYYERKGRVLDYLLALYGQKFTQNTLRYFNYYYHGEELDEVIVKNKIACLDAIVTFDRDRAAGYNTLASGWNTENVAGLQYRLSVLLGFRHTECRSLTLPLVKLGLKVVPHQDYRTMKRGSHELKMIDLSDIREHLVDGFSPVSFQRIDEEQAVIELADNLGRFVPLKNNIVSDALLQGGVSLERFRTGSLAPDGDYQMVFSMEEERDWWYIGRANTRSEASQNIKLLHRLLIHLNIESEGLHLLEHLLLRPQQGGGYDGLPGVDQASFYTARITVVFPAWSARCNDPRFRVLAEESVRSNCPAHIFADIYWFDFDTMYRFEALYKCWLDARDANDLVHVKTHGLALDDVDEAAKALIEFLCMQQGAGDE